MHFGWGCFFFFVFLIKPLFLQVNLKRPCPFWPDDGHCSIKDCHVEACPEVSVIFCNFPKVFFIYLSKNLWFQLQVK